MKNDNTLDRILRIKHLKIGQSERTLQRLATNRTLAENALRSLKEELDALEHATDSISSGVDRIESSARHSRHLMEQITKASQLVHKCVEAWQHARDDHSRQIRDATPLETLVDAKRKERRDHLIRVEEKELDDHVLRTR